MRVLAVIPIRKGSRGVLDKNIRSVGGQPLFAHMLGSVVKSGVADKVIVSTDDDDYASLARRHGAETPFLRPPELSDGRTRLHYVMRHALEFFDRTGERYDAVLSALATAPLIRPATVRQLVTRLVESGADAIGTGSEIGRGHPYLAKTMVAGDDVVHDFVALPAGTPRYPRQARPAMYYYNGALFLRRRKLLVEPDDETNALGSAPRMLVIPETEGFNIDTEEDLDFVRYVLEKK